MAELMLALDGGTESLRAAIFDLAGNKLGDSASPYPTAFPRPNWAEQNPDDWWASASVACQKSLQDAKVTAADIGAICADTTCCSVVMTDAAGNPLRPCQLWMDVRAADQARQVVETGDAALCVNSAGAGPVSAEWMIPKVLWVKQNEPAIYEQAAVVCEYQDWLNWKLTGCWVASMNNVAVRWHYATAQGGWPNSMLDRLDLGQLQDKWPSEILAPAAVIGGLTPAAATHLGLLADTPVIQGGADAFIGMVGLGAIEPGDVTLITGSSHLQFLVSDREYHAQGVWGTYADAIYPGCHILEGGQTSTGSVINWFKRNFAADVSYDELNAEAAKIDPGCDGLLSQDHFQGNRTPHTDPLSIGALVGLSLSHTRAHVYRAIIEGICFGTKLVINAFQQASPIKRIVVAGGATNSDLWLQIHADTLGLAIERTLVPEAPLLGDAILAAVGIGKFTNIENGCAAMVHNMPAGNVVPQPSQVEAYTDLYQRYLDLYPALRPFSAKQKEISVN